MNMFMRNIAPISTEALAAIDAQASRTLRALLSSRKFINVDGPKGWDCASISTGRLRDFAESGDISSGVRESISLVESRAHFQLDLFEMHNVDRGARDIDLGPVEQAARAAAAFEEGVVYDGCERAGIKGLLAYCGKESVSAPSGDPDGFIRAIAAAMRDMRVENSIEGPYALVGGCTIRSELSRLLEGRPLLKILKSATDLDEFIYTPLRDEAFIVSKRGGDFEMTIGGDYTVGFSGADGKTACFFLASSMAFRVLEPRACMRVTLK